MSDETSDTSEKRNEVFLKKTTKGAEDYIVEEYTVSLKSLAKIQDLEAEALKLWEEIKNDK